MQRRGSGEPVRTAKILICHLYLANTVFHFTGKPGILQAFPTTASPLAGKEVFMTRNYSSHIQDTLPTLLSEIMFSTTSTLPNLISMSPSVPDSPPQSYLEKPQHLLLFQKILWHLGLITGPSTELYFDPQYSF